MFLCNIFQKLVLKYFSRTAKRRVLPFLCTFFIMESLEYIIGSSSPGSGREEYFIYVIYLCYIKFLFVEGNSFPGNQNKRYIYLAKNVF